MACTLLALSHAHDSLPRLSHARIQNILHLDKNHRDIVAPTMLARLRNQFGH